MTTEERAERAEALAERLGALLQSITAIPTPGQAQPTSLPSVEIETDAKGNAKPKVKAYAETAKEASEIAQREYDLLAIKYLNKEAA